MSAAIGCSNTADAEMSSESVPDPISGLTSGTFCEDDPSLRYPSFGEPFMRSYCLRCHTSALVGSARAAPPDKNFDDLISIRNSALLIDQQAGAGPMAIHTTMPPDGVMPSIEERQNLSRWLACGAR